MSNLYAPLPDDMDIQLRNDFEYGVLRNDFNENTMFPDLTRDPLFVKTVPEVTSLNLPKPNDVTNDRTRKLSDEANEKIAQDEANKTNYGTKSIIDLFSLVSNNLMGITSDLLNNKDNLSIQQILTKDDRVFSIGVLMIFTAIFITLFSN